MPNFVFDYYQKVGTIGEGVLQLFSNLIVEVYEFRSSRLVGKFKGNVMVGV